MRGTLVRSLRRLADVLQRSLFDEADDLISRRPGGSAGGSTGVDGAGPAPAFAHAAANRGFVHDGHRIDYLLRRSRRRSIGFSVGVEGLVVTAPRWVALREIDAAVGEKARWIVARLVEQRALAARARAARTVWSDGASLRYLGESLTLVLDPAGPSGLTELVVDESATAAPDGAPAGRRLRVGLPADAAPERIRDAVQSWLQREAHRLFERRVAHFAARLDVRVTGLALSAARTRWGSANATGAIRLNWRLIHYPLATIDYVVAHELAHLREMNHGPRFWEIVRSVAPHADAARRELRQDAALHLDG